MENRRTLIAARYVVAHQDGGHALLENGQVVLEGNRIVYVGRSYPGETDGRIDAPSKLPCPGFISVHAHLANSPLTKTSYARYLAAGVNVALGTDTFPQDMLHEMRWAAVLAKVVECDPRVGTARDVFTSATLRGAHALGRDDLGRIAPGAKADLLLFNLDTLTMSPCAIRSRTSSSARAATTSTL